MLHRRQPVAPDRRGPIERRPWSATRRRTAAALAGLLAAAAALVGGVVLGRAGSATAAAAPAGSPYGFAEHMWFRPGGMSFIGWGIDPSAPKQAIIAYVVVDGKVVARSFANLPRADVAKAHPSAGPNHGFRFNALIPEGRHLVCVRLRNVGAGANVQLRCQTRVLDYGPIGAVQRVTAVHGQLTVSGWALDYDNRVAALTVALSVDGKPAAKLVAGDPNTTANGVAGAGPNHGFTFQQPAAQGSHQVCVRVTNIGYGTDTAFPCSNVWLNDSPRAQLDSAGQYRGKLRVRGWAFDPEAPTSPADVVITIDGTAHPVVANVSRPDVAKWYPGTGTAHGFDQSFALPEGSHTVTVTARNVQLGHDVQLAPRTVTLNFTPTARIIAVTPTTTGLRVTGWATDPDTSTAISVRVALDGKAVQTLVASGTGSVKTGHQFGLNLLTRSGTHHVCVTAINALYGTHDSPAACQDIPLALSPLGWFDSLARTAGSTNLAVKGWAFDPDSAAAATVTVTVDGVAAPAFPTGVTRTDVFAKYPSAGQQSGFAQVLTANDGEHTVCLTVTNVGLGTNTSLGCKLIIAVRPVAPSVPQTVTAQAGYGGATIAWQPPASDGGAPWSNYVVTSAPGGISATVSATTTSATIVGLKPSTSYSFTVKAINVAGTSPSAVSPTVTTQASPPPQTSPAPVSTSRYIRNIRSATSTELAVMRQEGATDAYYNPSGHGYLVLLDIGGQDNVDGGVVLSATTRFVTYGALVKDLESYVDGYASKQKPSAPAIIAVGTNNDMEVNYAAGKAWADRVVDPLVAYTRARYPGITIAGANDIEPGFRATYAATKSWLSGYLGATSAPFIFNGSADGCAWTVINRGCNNGWTMAGLYYLAAGAAPIRMLNLPQIYNYTMADQWKYISLTGVATGQPRINFAGTLTEWTACDQTNSCGSISGHSAWSRMWWNLQSDSRLKVGSLPYSTDLRIDR